ncbi:MAG: hypothetical protein ACP5FP_03575 [Desulfuromonadaceae bacterium]
MRRLLMGFVWLVIFMLLLVALDQLLLRYPGFEQGFLRDVQEFHADFRRRLFGLRPEDKFEAGADANKVERTQPTSAERPVDVNMVVEREIVRVTQQAGDAAPVSTEDGSLRYIYLDAEQNIQFVERYEDIPPRFRDTVQIVGE